MLLKILLLLLAMLIINRARVSAQISFPKGFKSINGERGSGLDDFYTNGRYAFFTNNEFVASDYYDPTDDTVRKYLRGEYGIPFYQTRDSLLWGTGKFEGKTMGLLFTQNG